MGNTILAAQTCARTTRTSRAGVYEWTQEGGIRWEVRSVVQCVRDVCREQLVYSDL